MERQDTLNPSRAEFAGKRKRCDKYGCDCMNKINPPKPLPHCSICRKYHTGECRKATEGCYRCGDLGHYIRDCPKPSRKSRKFVKAPAEAAESSASQETSSRVPAPVILVPQPEAEVGPKWMQELKFRDEIFVRVEELSHPWLRNPNFVLLLYVSCIKCMQDVLTPMEWDVLIISLRLWKV